MTNNDLFYVCSLIEFTARMTHNKRRVIVESLGIEGIKKELHDAPVNHCLTFDEAGSEIAERYGIKNGDFDTVTDCKYKVPSYQDIGKLYAIIIERLTDDYDIPNRVYNVFASFISDEISRFSTGLYYENPDYIRCCYEEGKILWD